MPELRSRMDQGPGAIPHVRQGFWIRSATPAAAVPQRKQAWRVTTARNKENNNPPRRSQLPAWYPRIPLRDITHIAHALERRRSTHIRRAQPNINENEVPPESVVLQRSHLFQDSNSFDHTQPSETLPDDSSETSTIRASTFSSAPPCQHSQESHSSSATTYFCPSELSSELELATSSEPTEYEKKLGNSIDEIEKAVFGNLKRMTMVAPKKKTGTLMSMR